MNLYDRIGRAAAALGLIFILAATLTPLSGGAAGAASTSFWCLVCGDYGGVDVTLNLMLFVPFALGLRLAGLSTRRVIVLSALLSIFVEGMQVSLITGRDASLSDLLTNTASGTIGAILASHLRTLVLPRPSLAATLAVVWAAAWLALLAGTAWLLQPSEPRGKLQVGWGPNLPSYAVFSGRVLGAAAGDIPLPSGVVADSVALRHRLATGAIELSFDAIVGRQRRHLAPIIAILDRRGPAAIVFERRDDLILELATHAGGLRLRNPAVRLDRGRPAARGELVRAAAGARGRTLWIASSYGGERWYRELRLSPAFGWSLLLPFEYAYGPEVHFLTALWIAGLLVPLGYWARRAQSPAWLRLQRIIGLGALVAVGLGLLPWLTGYPPVHRSEWLAAAVGLAVGWAMASRVTYLAGRCASPSASESYSS